MLTTFTNTGIGVSGVFGNICALFFDVSNDALEHHEYAGLWKLTLLTSLLQVNLIMIR